MKKTDDKPTHEITERTTARMFCWRCTFSTKHVDVMRVKEGSHKGMILHGTCTVCGGMTSGTD